MAVICQFAGLKPDMIRNLTAEGVIKSEKIPRSNEHHYHFLTTIQAMLLHYREKANARTAAKENAPVDDEIKELKAQEMEMKVRRQRVELDKEEGRVHATEQIKQVWGDTMSVFKSTILTLPTTAAHKLVGLKDEHEAFDALMDEMVGLLHHLVEYDEAADISRHMHDDDEDGEMIDEDEEEEVEAEE